jgi:hypothetical protein
MLGEWAGDEDLGSGALQLLYKEYRSRCLYVRQLGLIAQDFVQLKSELENDMVFLLEGEKVAKREYAKAIDISGKRESTLMELAWNVTGFELLVQQGNAFKNELTLFIEHIKMGEQNKVTKCLPHFKTKAFQYLREFYTKKRSPATHLLVFMISDESRNQSKLRELEVEVESAMKSLEMNVVGKYLFFYQYTNLLLIKKVPYITELGVNSNIDYI